MAKKKLFSKIGYKSNFPLQLQILFQSNASLIVDREWVVDLKTFNRIKIAQLEPKLWQKYFSPKSHISSNFALHPQILFQLNVFLTWDREWVDLKLQTEQKPYDENQSYDNNMFLQNCLLTSNFAIHPQIFFKLNCLFVFKMFNVPITS